MTHKGPAQLFSCVVENEILGCCHLIWGICSISGWLICYPQLLVSITFAPLDLLGQYRFRGLVWASRFLQVENHSRERSLCQPEGAERTALGGPGPSAPGLAGSPQVGGHRGCGRAAPVCVQDPRGASGAGTQTWPRVPRVPTGAEPCILKAERFLYCVNSWLPVP